VRELLDGVSNEFDNSIRALPTQWTEEVWREVYNFGTGGGGLAGRKDEYVKDCFKALPNPKDGYDIEDCKDPRHRRLLAFLAPIVYPDKPNRITVTLGNTIFGALIGGRKVNWARIITNLVIQLASRVGKTRASPICPFLYHLYERRELLKPEEERTWKIQEGMMKYGEFGSSDEAESGTGSEDETKDNEEEEEETQVLLSQPPKRTRQVEKTALGGSLLTPKVEGVPATSSKDRFEAICQALDELQGEHRMRGELMRIVCQIVDYTPTNLPDRIRSWWQTILRWRIPRNLERRMPRSTWSWAPSSVIVKLQGNTGMQHWQQRSRSGRSHIRPARWWRRRNCSMRRWESDRSHPEHGLQ
jgi:hypothetical protein